MLGLGIIVILFIALIVFFVSVNVLGLAVQEI